MDKSISQLLIVPYGYINLKPLSVVVQSVVKNII